MNDINQYSRCRSHENNKFKEDNNNYNSRQNSNEDVMNFNESIFSFRYLNFNRDNSMNNKRRNNKFFESEFKEVIENIKDLNPDTYFKHKLDMMKNNIENLNIKYKSKANIISMRERNKNFFIHNKATILVSIMTIIILIVSIVIYYSPLRFKNILTTLDQSPLNKFACITIVIIITLVIICYCNYKNSEITRTHNKLIAENCIMEIESILKQNEEGSMLDIDKYSQLFCEDHNIQLDQFKNTILTSIKDFIKFNETNLCEVIYQENLYLMLK